jgi:hypothetical protein
MDRSRAELKPQRRAQSALPTKDADHLAAIAGPDALADALVARHAARIENLDSIPEQRLEKCYRQLYYLHDVSTASGIFLEGPLLLRRDSRNTADYMLWATQSAMAAIRLLLAGQFVGAAILVRQQLGRWTLLLAETVETASDGPDRPKSADELMKRVWTESAIAALGRSVADVPAEGRFDDIDDIDEPIAGLSTTTTFGRIRLANGRSVCPATIYRLLSQIASGTGSSTATRWECLQTLNPKQTPSAINAVISCISDGLELCILNLQHAVGIFSQALQQHNSAEEFWLKASSTETDVAPSDEFTVRMSELCDSEVPTLTPGLIPITPIELAASHNWDYLAEFHDQYCRRPDLSFLATQPAQAEVAKLAFLAHRYTRLSIVEESQLTDLKKMTGDVVVQHISSKCAYILTAELAVVCAKWNRSRREIATAAMLISSTLRSGYWLWLEEDDRAMGILRWTLHHAARLRSWYINAELARQLESKSLTSHRDWIIAAGWQDLLNLDLALFEFAHANPDSRTDATATLHDDPSTDTNDPVDTRRARQEVLDQVTALAASEMIRIIAAHQSTSIAQAVQAMLRLQGLDIWCDLQQERDFCQVTQLDFDVSTRRSPRSASGRATKQ